MKAIAVFTNDITEYVKFTEHENTVRIDINLKRLKPKSLHGFHVHEANKKGEAIYYYYDDVIKLHGFKSNIIGRGLIIHEDEDDCGQGGDEESLKTGNAGKRIACAVIGYSKDNFPKK